jgi:hypothetical protein
LCKVRAWVARTQPHPTKRHRDPASP